MIIISFFGKKVIIFLTNNTKYVGTFLANDIFLKKKNIQTCAEPPPFGSRLKLKMRYRILVLCVQFSSKNSYSGLCLIGYFLSGVLHHWPHHRLRVLSGAMTKREPQINNIKNIED